MLQGKTRNSFLLIGWMLACVLSTSSRLTALVPPSSANENYTTRKWQIQDGLPQQTVQAFAQTPDGFLWIGTTGGLLRFDGSRFVTFDRVNTPAFEENSVFSLLSGRDGMLWIGTDGGGLIRMKGGHFHRFGVSEGLLDGFVRTILEDRQGSVWIGTDNGLFRLANSSAEHVIRVDGTAAVPSIAVHALAQAADGTIWAGGSRLMAIHEGVAKEYPLDGQFSETRVKSVLQTADGTLWVGTVSGLEKLAVGSRHFRRFSRLQGTVRALRQTRDGAMWIGTIGEGVYRLRDGKISVLNAATAADTTLPSKTVLSLFEDDEDNLWMGTQAGLIRLSHSVFDLIPLPRASDSDFETISQDSDGTLWVAGTHLIHLSNGIASLSQFPELRGARVRNVFRDADGFLWMGTDGRGLFRLKPGLPARHYTTANGLVNNFVRGILQAANKDLWIATDEGVSRWSAGKFKNFTVQDGLAYFSVRALIEDRSGDIWIGTDRGLSHLAHGQFVFDPATAALAGQKVWALHQSPGGALWLGTRDNGLYRYLPGSGVRHFTTEQGLASNSVYALLEDKQGRLWAGGEDGVDVLQLAELENAAVQQRAYLPQHFFPVSQGGELSPLYGGTMPSGTITSDGDAWFPTSKGPVRFVHDAQNTSGVPVVFLDQLVADGTVMPLLPHGVELGAGNRNIEIAYGSILLGPQDGVQFQYKLDGFDTGWRYGSNRRVADYTNLPPGKYTFHVRAFQQSSGKMTERTLILIKKPHFYVTWWFMGLCSALLAASAWWIHRQRLRRVEAAYKAVLDERARLAREMHDTLIQGCTGVSLLLEAATAEAAVSDDGGADVRNTEIFELLSYARTQLASSIDEARQAIWNLRKSDSGDFKEMLQSLMERLARSSGVTFHYQIRGEVYTFQATAMHEIAMATREAVFNALLHASPTRIEVNASFGKDRFRLEIEDNGSGFERTPAASQGHFGLTGIEERVRGLGGILKVTSAASSGTCISIELAKDRVVYGAAEAERLTEDVLR